MNPPSAPLILGSARTATIVGSIPPGNRLARTDGPGNAENYDQTDLVSPSLLAAAAARFTEMSAEELCAQSRLLCQILRLAAGTG